jgi:hypothetical protein
MVAESQRVTKMCVPYGEMAPFELLDCVRIRHHGLFFEVTDETVASSWGNNIRQDFDWRARVSIQIYIRVEVKTYKKCCKKRPARREQVHEVRFQDYATS